VEMVMHKNVSIFVNIQTTGITPVNS